MAGPIPTEIGLLTAMKQLVVYNNKLDGMCCSPLEFGVVNEFTIVKNALARPHSDGDWAVPPVDKPYPGVHLRRKSADRFVCIL